ncbi:uncharacterized protein LOC111789703 isoform X4 [Cucurbita pepo subsp. pepo]|uniref:uncharacterized protein LOC111789703 isoform X4 n=1 Tax=Cucurbita pepo subsp. pepo TaxID=3664 RepID=UPI000C9D3DC8|nr:uncharacterized protein LOC111789703 isoform X4 [Cucurbita pepo subsp. pepo]
MARRLLIWTFTSDYRLIIIFRSIFLYNIREISKELKFVFLKKLVNHLTSTTFFFRHFYCFWRLSSSIWHCFFVLAPAKELEHEIATVLFDNIGSLQGHNDNGVHTARSHLKKGTFEGSLASNDLRRVVNVNSHQDQEAMELSSRVRAQEGEIQLLRQQISVACLKELRLLNEKYALERKFSDIRMAVDEKQTEAINSAFNELGYRKGDLEVNLKLTNELKAVDDERYHYTSSLLGLLGEYGIWPHVMNASVITNSVKLLHDQLQWKIRTSYEKIGEQSSLADNHLKRGFNPYQKRESTDFKFVESGYQYQKREITDMGTSKYQLHPKAEHLRTTEDVFTSRIQNNIPGSADFSLRPNMYQPVSNDNSPDPFFNNGREMPGAFTPPVDDDAVDLQFYTTDERYNHPVMVEGPSIENFQIVGEATPGSKLLACGYPTRGTSLCIFQWIWHLEDGTRQYVEGATNPEYVVGADDVDKLLAVECIPMDENGHQGELVKLFANDQHKIKCDPDMQLEIDTYLSKGQATFTVLLLIDLSENWEPASISLRRSGYQIKMGNTEVVVIAEKYSRELSLKIPPGISTQFVLTCSDGSSLPFNAYDVSYSV